MNGFEFVLLAIRGRLAEANLTVAERTRLEGFLADYSRIAQAYRERREERQDKLVLRGPVVVDLAAFTKN